MKYNKINLNEITEEFNHTVCISNLFGEGNFITTCFLEFSYFFTAMNFLTFFGGVGA
jgi:hypothetical protein